MREVLSCPICEKAEFEIVHTWCLVDTYKKPEEALAPTNSYRRNYLLFEQILKRQVSQLEVEFRLCLGCGLIFFSPRPDDADMAIKYQMVAREKDTERREQKRRLVDLRKLRATRISQTLQAYLDQETGRAVDIGGADGHCLAGFTGDFDCGVLDFEDRASWPGVRKLGNTLNDLDDEDLFDLALSCHTLEHVPNPCSFVASLKRHLVEGGIAYIEVPYGCSNEIYTTRNLLTHVNFFSEGSLGYLLEQAGLHVEYLHSGPVLSTKRFLPVITAIARRDDARSPDRTYLQNALSITRRQMRQKLDASVTAANIKLVLGRPVQYAKAFAVQVLSR